jgi:hypothetical protein
MSWAFYGEWEFDHIIPVKFPGANGGPPSIDEIRTRLHFSNMQPRWAPDNIAKSNRWSAMPRAPLIW